MPLINLTIKHGTTLDNARQQLESAVNDARAQLGAFINQVTWSGDRSAVTLTGPGVVVELKVDAEHVHAVGDIPLLGALLGSSVGQKISQGIKGVLARNFPKGLPSSGK